ncbi:fatty acid oxidation complex subunit alpha FadB [Catenovulum sp. 2E275]|uniref:fatty acid oxidation complex subunit alpha FadB n=1 Tax=Catenovulum sp. 2E275 TaxID=2980497 RepID=UPI0021D273DD|nr:fatty acid oxidation complex subunit alpha FadB [Catenovulum sp. 2E275]MCU4676586.1 fatty acid oxidation complex subunit alpha FadB [Catenovulum sp. 2E275]
MIYSGQNIKLNQLDNQLAELVLDSASSVNKFDQTTLAEFETALVQAQQANVKGLLIRSEKPAFIVGADITEFLGKFKLPIEELGKWLKHATDIFDLLEDLPFPTVSAINGYALGGGCEAILATDYRIADNTARIGLPEVKLGIMPGFGGTVRMSRLIGADNAMKVITTGQEQNAKQCLDLGIVDAVIDTQDKTELHQAALECLQKAASGEFNWQAKRAPKLTALKLSATERAMSFNLAKAMVFQQAGKHYPAPMMAVNTIEAGAELSRSEAMLIENKNFIKLTQTPQARALVGVFLADQQIKSRAKQLSKNVEPPAQAGILGAGIMGGGIAYQSAYKGIGVYLKDINQAALDLGITTAAQLLHKQVERGKLTPEAMLSTLTSIKPSLEDNVLKQTDIIVEAVVERADIKQQVLQQTEAVINDDCILASNTSTISITELAKSLKRPEQFCGMHFFNPVHRMPLVEVIRGQQTSEQTIAKVVAYASKMGKSAIVVNDCPGFFVNRVLFPYLAAFNQLLTDGADFIQVDKVMEKQFGWPMGPAYLLDVIGLDTALHAQKVMAQGFPQRMPLPELNLLEKLNQANRLGQKTKQGFYQYQKDKKGKLQKQTDEFVHQLLADHQIKPQSFSDEDIINRLMLPMLNETLRCYHEGIVENAEAADMALIYGLGFPPFRGGAFRYIENIGLDNLIKQAEQLADLGALYQLPDEVTQKAGQNFTYLAN